MPAVLTENLFIDVAADAAKLKRQKIIDALIAGHVAGIAKYLGLIKNGSAATVSDKVSVVVNGKQIKDGKLENGVTYVLLRAVGEALGTIPHSVRQIKTHSRECSHVVIYGDNLGDVFALATRVSYPVEVKKKALK